MRQYWCFQIVLFFPEKFPLIWFLKHLNHDHISSHFTSDIPYLMSAGWRPKMQNLKNLWKKEGVVAVLKDGKGLGRVPASQLKSNRHYLYSVLHPSRLQIAIQSPNFACAVSRPFSGCRLILDSPLSPFLMSYQMPTCRWRPTNSNNMKCGTFSC